MIILIAGRCAYFDSQKNIQRTYELHTNNTWTFGASSLDYLCINGEWITLGLY